MQAIQYVIRGADGRAARGSLDPQIENVAISVDGFSDLSLNVGKDDVHAYKRVGSDLLIQLEDGREILIQDIFLGDGGQAARLYFSESGTIQEITFTEAWGRTNYAQFGEAGANSDLIFSSSSDVAGVHTASSHAVGTTTLQTTTTTLATAPEVTMAAAVPFFGVGGAAAAGGAGAAIAAGAVGVGALALGGGSSDGSGGTGSGTNGTGGLGLVTGASGDISIDAIGTGSDAILNGVELAAGPVVTGRTLANTEVTITLGAESLTTLSDASGNYTVAFDGSDFAGGEYTTTVTASITDSEGAVKSATTDVQIDTVTDVDIHSTIVEGDGVILAAETVDGIVVTGTSEASANVIVSFQGATQPVTADSNGNWSVTFAPDLLDGINAVSVPITVSSTDLAGNVATTTENVMVDTVLDVSIDTVQLQDNIMNINEASSDFNFTGTTNPGASVTVEFNGQTANATVAVDGTWVVTFPASAAPTSDAVSTILAHASDTLGNATSDTHTIQYDSSGFVVIDASPIEIDDVVNLAEHGDGVVVTGTTSPGATVVVHFHQFSGNATVAADGSWTVDVPASNINVGEYAVTISAISTTPNGNVSTDTEVVNIDTLVNALTLAGNAVSGDNFVNADEQAAGVAISGTVEPGSTVVVQVGNVTKTAVVNSGGTWSVTFLPAELPAGDYTTSMIATATDAAGNTKSLTQDVVVDTIASNLTISDAPIEGDGVVNAAEISDGINLTGLADPGVEITVTFNGVPHIAVAGDDGVWNIFVEPTEIPTGTVTVPIIISTTDDAGNVTAVTTSVGIDTEVSGVVIPDDDIADDGVVNGVEATAGVVLVGAGEPGATVSIAVGNVPYTTTVGIDGTWTINLPTGAFPTGETTIDLVVTVTDLAGNIFLNTTTLDVDTLVTNLAVTGSTMRGETVLNSFVAQTGISMSGTVEAGSTIMVTFEDTTKAATVNSAGQWSVTFSGDEVRVGEYETNAVIVATDASGNVAQTTEFFKMDTSVPGAPEIVVVMDEGAAGIRGIVMPDTGDEYSVHVLNDNETTTEIGLSTSINNVREEITLNFNANIDQGDDMIIASDDDAGNQSSTLFVMDAQDSPQVSMGNAGLTDFNIEAVDLVFADDAELTLTASQLEGLSDLSDNLLVRGGADDTVVATGATHTGNQKVVEGETYDVYSMGTNGGLLVVDEDIDVIT